MAYEIPGNGIGVLNAGADLSTKQYYVVKVNTSGAIILGAATTDRPLGVLQNNPTSGKTASVMTSGVTKAIAGAAIAAGAQVSCNASGQVITAVTTSYSIGTALVAAAALGDVISISLDAGKGIV